jgi:hypothetical protein
MAIVCVGGGETYGSLIVKFLEEEIVQWNWKVS